MKAIVFKDGRIFCRIDNADVTRLHDEGIQLYSVDTENEKADRIRSSEHLKQEYEDQRVRICIAVDGVDVARGETEWDRLDKLKIGSHYYVRLDQVRP